MAQTLKFGNKVWAAKEGAVLAYNDENSNYKPLPFDFTRASSATRFNKSGLIETMRTGVARIDYLDSADGVLLLEPASTNLITYSEAFDNPYWTKSGSSVVSGFTSPDGTNNAFKLVEDTSGGAHFITTPITWAADNNTFSIYAKSNGRNWIRLNTNDSTGNNLAWFNISNGTLGSKDAGITTSITLIADGWYRCSMTKTLTSFAGGATILIADADGSSTYTGNGTSGIYIFGAQLEQQSYPTSYIPTSGSTVTRVAEEVCINSGNSEVFNDSEGVLFVNVNLGVNQSASRYFAISDGTNNNRIQLGRGSSAGSLSFFVRSNGSSTIGVIIDEGTGEILKLAVKYKSNDYAIWSNGFEIYQNSSVSSTPLNISRFNFAEADGVGSDFYGKTKEVGYYNTALTDLELETLTSYRNWISMVNELNLNIIYNG